MSCVSPILATRQSDGSMKILSRDRWSIFEAERYFGKGNVFFLPCGKCSACKLAKRKEYAIRCAMEAKSYEKNAFITLTYDDDNNPGYLRKRDLQYFIKKIRNKGFKIRYFGCGEYGSINERPHYHIVLFGFMPDDIKLFSESKTNVPIFRSKFCEDIWKKGFVSVQTFSPECAGYVAGYVQKKVGDDKSFLIMSKKPGLGYQYLKQHAEDFIEFDCVCDDFGNIKKAKSPRYFERVAEKLGLDLTYTKQKRLEIMSDMVATELNQFGVEREALLQKKKEVSDKKLKKLRREL